jgi:hypothetical protein
MHLTLGGDTLKRITKAALGGVASCALILGGAQVAGAALLESYKFSRAELTDLVDTTRGPFDGAKAKTTVGLTDTGGTTISVRVTGIDTSALPEPLPTGGIGAHLHLGPCASSGFHYKDDISVTTAERWNEFWFDFIPDAEGMAYDETTMPFVPIDEGEMSIVIHAGSAEQPTSASAKQACFPLAVSGIFPKPPTE